MSLVPKSARIAGVIALGMLLTRRMAAQDPPQNPPKDLTQASLEDLMNLQVTSVSKKEQKLFKTGAAVFVITQEDIRRSGATAIPDVLRMAPGVNVARLNANSWAVSIRGFNDLFADQTLVLVDGRSVYDPLFSGVYWGDLDVPLEDIERIEVIRGPGGTVWGANAMNGVINIITRNSHDTKGGLVTAGGGNETPASGLVQYGGQIGDAISYRVFEKYFDIDHFKLPSGGDGLDGWHSFHEGFRADVKLSADDTLMVEADVKQTGQGQIIDTVIASALPLEETINDLAHNSSVNILGLWNHTTSSGNQVSFQGYDNYLSRSQLGQHFVENTVDLDLEDHMSFGTRQDLVWGAGVRVTELQTRPGYAIAFSPLNRTDLLASIFIQDEVRITDSLSLTAGSKFEHNSYTGFEAEPSAQLAWMPSERQSVWISAARSIRQPDMVDTQVRDEVGIVPVAGFPFGLLTLVGNPNPRVEKVNDYEAGYRRQAGKRFSVDVAAFASFFSNMRSGESLTPYVVTTPAYSYLALPVTFEYYDHVKTHGGEIFATWNATSRWRMSPSYSLFHLSRTEDAANVVTLPDQSGKSSPTNQFELRSLLTLPHNFEWDATVSYTSSIMGGAIPAYTQVDTRVGWRFKRLEFSVTGNNLLKPWHAEFPNEIALSTLIPRSVFAQIAWRF